MIILGIDTSCDDTAVAILQDGKVLNEVVSTQLEHKEWGGVVPEIASRAHLRNIIPVTQNVLEDAGISASEVGAVAVTVGPGLIGALLVGLNFARGWTDAAKIPLVGINHLQAHIWAAEIETETLQPPFISLIVSGGHTSIALVEDIDRYRTLGQTVDDAAGEVLDKIGRLLGLSYPCGAQMEKIAQGADPTAVKLPRGMKGSRDFNFSFSGLKTAAKLFLDKNPEYLKGDKVQDFIASLQEAVLDILVEKTIRAAEAHRLNTIVLGGGVAANSRLREKFLEKKGINLRVPAPKRCTDNGVMVAHLAQKKLSSNKWKSEKLIARADWGLES
jgi:N6-L-threonylcarbamoyladenine synthase